MVIVGCWTAVGKAQMLRLACGLAFEMIELALRAQQPTKRILTLGLHLADRHSVAHRHI